jgi:mRNA interferase MazF
VELDPDGRNGLASRSAAQCQQLRSVSRARVGTVRGNVGPVSLGQLREVIALLLDLA